MTRDSRGGVKAPYSGGGAKQAVRTSAAASGGDSAIKFLLSNSHAGTLIGTGGKAIKELMEVTGAAVHVSAHQQLFPGTDSRVIYITGHCHKAIACPHSQL